MLKLNRPNAILPNSRKQIKGGFGRGLETLLNARTNLFIVGQKVIEEIVNRIPSINPMG
ncbi:hypothetical protein RHAA1_02149 [Aggregatibacter actinomycetemcomitans RhAA1]|nr:hypothetical protein RHAA1_02149 [Aggregatibacter actinomycetemcomitans RhAA1]